MTDREEFEAWADKVVGVATGPTIQWTREIAWEAWQAARATALTEGSKMTDFHKMYAWDLQEKEALDANAFSVARARFGTNTELQDRMLYQAILVYLEAARSTAEQSDTKPSTEQDWAKLDGAVAFHLIERHAEDWSDTGAMMDAWRKATAERDSVIDQCAAVCQRQAAEVLNRSDIHADGRTVAHAALLCAMAEIRNLRSQQGAESSRFEAWISVEERLPNESEMVLVFRPDAHHLPACDPNIDVRAYFGNGVFNGIHEVTHWMPLPAVPDAAIESTEKAE